MGQPDPADTSSEEKVVGADQFAKLVRMLPGFDGFRFDPLALIKAVNYLHGLGLAGSLQTLHHHGQTEPENVLLIARLLYVPANPEEAPPTLDLGLPDLGVAQDPAHFPLFPLHLLQDLPLLLTGGYLVGGEGQPPSVYLDWCAGQARLRPAPLHPGDKLLAAVEAFLASAAWQRLNPDSFHAGMLRLQVLRALPGAPQATEEQKRALRLSPEPTPFWLTQLEREKRSNP